ncbi:outer membrane protein [Tatumella citrea]|uniref:Outer membrane protein beta-barrel domain-containing protein n=1 Tax=Tatumella citrea TaxID=53336 RepID=A0A1Y0LCN2_TATCI|nr:outer membrane protein [Tatumella citrea]ARU95348.1 hypothetical protein A7K98_17350 [Tatumella citrea]ARU99389.1 hypothetical protein A7K99_17335 [Tatumella citrea]
MKKFILTSLISLLSVSTVYAADNSGVYVSGKVGSSIENTHGMKYDYAGNDSKSSSKSKGVFGGGVAVGYDFYSQYQFPVRVEIASTFRGKSKSVGEADNGSVSTRNKVRMDTYMVNGYYDLHNQSAFTPYLTAGIGIADLKLKNSFESGALSGNSSDSNTNFAWDVGLGVKYAVTTNIAIDASYVYTDGGKSHTSNSYGGDEYRTRVKSSSNDIMLGVSYMF